MSGIATLKVVPDNKSLGSLPFLFYGEGGYIKALNVQSCDPYAALSLREGNFPDLFFKKIDIVKRKQN